MQVDTRRIYPLNYDDRILLNEIEGYEWRTVCRVPIIRASANAPLRTPGSFRKYRLRATYYDDERTETYNRYLELMIRFEPPGSFKTLRLQKASCDNNTTLSSFTEMFTSLLRPEEDGFLAINVQFANASVEDGLRLRAALYSLDLETWEFSSPSPPIHINPHRAESYAWTRPLFPASRKPVEMYTHSGDVPFSCEINLLSYFTERQDSHAEMKNNGQIFGLTLRTLAAAISSKAKLTVTFLFESDSELDHTWEFTMIPDTMGNPFMIHNDGGPWYTNELFRDEKTEIEISITTDNPLSIVTVYQLHLDVVYAAQDSPELVQRLPNISKAEDDLISGQNVLLSHSGEPLNIGMKHPFVSSAPILGMDEARQFVLRLTLQNQVPEDTVFGISMTLVESGGELRTLEFSSKFKSTTAKAAGYMWLSEPFQFHDGRYPSLPADDWTLKLSYFGGIYNNGVCYLLDVSLEARDHPIVDLTVPRSVQLALDITEKSIEIPHSQVLAPGSTPFTLAMWCSSLGQYIDADEPEDDYFHIICSYGETLTMGITNEGVLRAELSHKDGSPRTVATIAGHGLNEPMVWHHLAITWDTTTLRLTVDGVFPSERFHAEGPLLESPNAGFVFGGKTFAGFIRSVSFWSSALEQDSICKAMYTVPGTQPGLLAAIEFSSGKPLIVCPKAKEVGEFQLPTDMKYVVEGRALAVAPAGCVSLGRDEALHMVGNQSFTLEVWFSQSVTQGIQMLAGRVVDSTHGYVLGLTGDRIFGRRDDVIVVMPLGFNFDPSLFWHRAGLVYDAQFETLTLYVDGVRASQESCSTPSLHLVVDAKDVAFTVGGRIDPISEYLYEDSFCGWIGQVCVWKVPRSPHHMKHSLINLPDPGAPALAGYFGFDGISMTNIGYGSPPLCLGNAQISDRMEIGTAQYLGSITGIDSRLLALPLDPSVSTPTPATSPNQVERMKSTEELIAEDDESTRIWLEFMVDLFAAVLEAVGFDIEDKTCLVQVCSIIWDHDRIRSSVVGFSQLDEKSLISLLDGVPSHRSLMMAADSISSPIENSSKRDVDPHIVTTMVVGLVFDLVRAGLFRNLIKAVPKVSWWSLIRVEAKLVPYVGEVYLAFCVMRLSFKIIKAILRLKERIKENEEKNSRPGLVVKWIRDSAADVQDVVVIPLGTVIPLRVGGSYQKMAIGLNPPSSLEPVTVALQVSQLGLELSLDKSSWIFNTVITFPPKVYGFQTVFVRASEIAAVGDFSTVSVVMKANAPAREVRVKFDIRKQSISAEPAVLTLDADKVDDYRIFSVWMDAIIDRDDQKIKLRFKESKDNQLDDDLLDLKFDPETIEFKRANDVQHKSTEIEVKVSLKQKKNFEKSLDRAIDIKKHFKIIEESGTGVAEVKRDIKVTGTHTTIITMIRAGKGDCYIVSDRLGNETQFVHALIDGGARGTHGRIKAAMNDSELNIEKFEFINCTHYDDDHIRGLLDMFKKEPNRKFAKLGLFNDPDSAISDRLSNPPPLPKTEIGEQDIEHSCLHPLDAAFSTYRLGDNLGSPNQGRALVTLLRNACDKVLGPENHGPAVSNPTQDSLRDYHFGNLNVAITGPTSTNRTEMNGTPGDSVKCNRSSTILTFRSQPEVNDGFNALFTGDAHDTLPSHNDIRGKPDLTQLLADHFLVMKVPHHGSGLSEDESFYKAYTADIYLISSYYKVHKIPKIQIIRSMVQGCSEKKKSPKFFTTSTYNKDTLYENMENDLQLKTEFLNAGAEMWFFADGTDYAKLRFNGSSLVEWPRTMMLKWP